MKISILYTSDVHGQLTATHYASNTQKNMGLVRLPAYLKTFDHPTLLLDNGDVLQGSVLLDYARQNHHDFPVAPVMNHLNYQAMTLGNHDFNYGLDFLTSFTEFLHFPVLCANVVNNQGHPVFKTHEIFEIDDLKIGVMGLITQYVPVWEKPEHIQGLSFIDPVITATELVKSLRPKVDILIALYHGGFEKDPVTFQPIGRSTLENQGVALSQVPGIDVLLTGHQHLPTALNHKPAILQTPAGATHVGRVTLTLEDKTIIHQEVALDPLDTPIDESLLSMLRPLEEAVETWLDKPLATSEIDLSITDPLKARLTPHPLFHWMNQIQRSVTGAMLSAAALPNEPVGFKKIITIRDVAANFVYPNTLVVLEVTGQMIQDALEQTTSYFALEDDQITINQAFLYPKIEHYNYDVYDPLDITVDILKPLGSRVTALYENKPLDLIKTYTLVLTNYRASGGGDYLMFKDANVIKEYDQPLFDIFFNHLKHHQKFKVTPSSSITVKK
jgi:2',3'-cyclic-nucleotide 2'-phosphodiesterase / 3'-nucleotidase